MTPPSNHQADLLESVVAHALELRDQGHADWLEIATKDCPEITEAVREAVGSTDLMEAMFAAPLPSETSKAQVLSGRFRLTERIGVGAMGVVYLAEDRELVRTVAVKVLRGGLIDPKESMRRFLREAEAMASAQHPSIIAIYDRGQTDDGELYIVMEWIEGMPLGTLIEKVDRKSQRPGVQDEAWAQQTLGISARHETTFVRMAVSWIADLAAGLDAVHKAGVLHRDIKPSNVIVRKDGRPVLLDFGLALLNVDSTLTHGSTNVGTPAYMPPESLARGESRTEQSDIYSLAATLYHLLTGQAPYQGTPSEVLAGIATREPIPASRLAPGLPRDLQAILDKGMQRRPRARYASAGAFEADLRAFLEFRPVAARPVSALQRTLRKWTRSKAARGAAMAIGLVLLLGAGLLIKQSRATRLHAEAFEIRRKIPTMFTIVNPSNRPFRYDEDRLEMERLLDVAITTGNESISMRLLRASFLLDNDRLEESVEDMNTIAGELGTPYSAALAIRYAAITDKAIGPDLTNLPDPNTPFDRYLHAYHLIRLAQDNAGYALLSDPEVITIPHAQELRLTCTPLVSGKTEANHELALTAFNEVLELEQTLGGRTVTTAHIAGRMLDNLQRYREGLDVFNEGIALAERNYTIRINAGYSAFRLGLFDEAQQHLSVATDMRPNYSKPLHTLVWVYLAMGEYDEAEKSVLAAPLDPTDKMASWRMQHLASIEIQRALDHKLNQRLDMAQTSIHKAVEFRLAAQTASPLPEDADTAILAGLQAGDEEAVYLGLAKLLLKDPANSWVLQSLIQNQPKDLSAEASTAVNSVLRSLLPPDLNQ